MSSDKTTATELSVAFGLLDIVPDSTEYAKVEAVFCNTLDEKSFDTLVRETVSKPKCYEPFFALGRELRRSYRNFQGTSIAKIKWEGPNRQPDSVTVSCDLLTLNTPISVKDRSNVIYNLSPHNLLVGLPQGQSGARGAPHWYLHAAHDEYQALYKYVTATAKLHLPDSVDEYERLKANKTFGRKFNVASDCIKESWPEPRCANDREFQKYYRALCQRVSIASADWFNQHIHDSLTSIRKRSVTTGLFRQFFRVDTVTSVFCGIERGKKFAFEVLNTANLEKEFRLKDIIANKVLDVGQPTVEFHLSIESVRGKQVYDFYFRAEIRWSHGKFNSCPEAKLYKGTQKRNWSWSDIPFYTRIVGERPNKPALLKKIGSGGFGVVWVAEAKGQPKHIALKELNSPIGGSDPLLRFQREIRIIQCLSHPNIIDVLDADLGSDDPWFTMPLAVSSVADRLSDYGKDTQLALRDFREVLEGVTYAHGMNVIHRDIKPDNILILEPGNIVLSDFGLGKNLESTSTPLGFTRDSAGIGTENYCAPEQEENINSADARSDIYSLGIVLYEMLTGMRHTTNVALNKVQEPLSSIISRCIEEDPKDRYQAVQDLLADFDSAFPHLKKPNLLLAKQARLL
jgi:hypothetical protein